MVGVRRLCKTKLRLALNGTAHTPVENSTFPPSRVSTYVHFVNYSSARLARTSFVESSTRRILTIKTHKIKRTITNVIVLFMVGVRRLELLTLSL